MATFEQRESGWWQARVRRKGYPTQSKTFPTKTDAEAWSRKVESEIDRGIFVSAGEAERTTLTDLIKRFKTEFAPHHYRRREDEQEAWRHQLARLDEALGDYSLAAIDQKLVAKYRDERRKGREGRKPVSDSTVRKELYLLSKLLGFAQTEAGIVLPRGNPVELVRKPSDGRSRDRRLTDEEMTKLETEIAKSRNPWIANAFALALETAMRQGELLSMRWQDVDLTRKIVMLCNPDKIKNEEPRAVPLSPRAVEVFKGMARPIKGGVVFPVERMTLYHAFVYACRRAGIKDYTWHDLRHEALSRLAERGDLSVLELAAVSGHKTLQMLKRYTHLQAEKLADKLAVIRS
jgi:integrase